MTAALRDTDLKELQQQLEESAETLRAIRNGEVDALVVQTPEGDRVYTLQGADHFYRVLIENMQQGAASLNADGTILFCNRCFAEMVQLPHEKVVGTGFAQLLPEAQRPIFTELLQAGRSGKSQGELELPIAGGTALPVLVALSPLPLDRPELLCMVVTDLTEHKKHKDLQLANRRKDEFLAMLAHELRNPLAPIQHSVAILQHGGAASENLTYAGDIIGRQVQHLARLVDDLLDVSRITLGKVVLHKERVELATVLARAVETSRPVIDARRHRLTLSLPPRGVRVLADPTRLAQVIGNLLTNAAKYTDEGGDILLACQREGDEVVIRVRDTGMGIPSELLPQVFGLFIQGERSLDRSEGGLGIGLTLVHRLVDMHAGTVEAQSDGPGKGSEFVVRLPALADEPQSLEPEAAPDSGPGGNHCVLVVEDNRDGADSLAVLLNLMGHQVRVAYNGSEAVQLANTLRPHVVLLDIGLPGMSGYEVARHLRDLPGFEKTLLIAMTGYGQEEDRQRGREAGFDHYLVKPVDLDKIEHLLKSIE
jgi:PAS domain S-box-containing protein